MATKAHNLTPAKDDKGLSLCDRCMETFQQIQALRRDMHSGIDVKYLSEEQFLEPHREITGQIYRVQLADFTESLSLPCHFCTIAKEYLPSALPAETYGIEIAFHAFLPLVNRTYIRVHDAPTFIRSLRNSPIFQNPAFEDSKEVSSFQHASCTSSEAHEGLARHWTDECREKHKDCKIRADRKSFIPTRLLQMDDKHPDTIRLHLTSPEETDSEYATLSHCWGGAKNITQLTTKTEADLTSGIPFNTLPRNFQDAILITRSLGLHYLWVDSLCIKQDSVEDWRKEASRMASVYENAYVTIAAAAGPDPHYGCYSTRDVILQSPLHIPSEDPKKELYIVPPWNVTRNKTSLVGKSSLLTRGWVFQEMILSPRILLFCRDGLAWSCRTGDASDVAPWGNVPGYGSDGRPRSIATPTSSSNYHDKFQRQQELMVFIPGRSLYHAVLEAAEKVHTPQDRDGKIEFSELWLSLVKQYTERNLTFGKDRFIAFSAIAQNIKGHSGFKYTAGLWEDTLPYDLLWVPQNPENTKRPEIYQAPSWSWGAIDGAISNDRWGSGGGFKSARTECCIDSIHVEVHTHADDTSATGQVLEGSKLLLDGCLQPCSLMANRGRDVFRRVQWQLDLGLEKTGEESSEKRRYWAGFTPDIDAEVESLDFSRIFLLPVLSADRVRFSHQTEKDFWGLVLMSHQTYYSRVGVFNVLGLRRGDLCENRTRIVIV